MEAYEETPCWSLLLMYECVLVGSMLVIVFDE